MYCKIKMIKNGRAAISYCEGSGQGHNGHAERNVMVIPINLIPNGRYADQMEKTWIQARQKIKKHLVHIICSFSEKELNPDDESDISRAGDILKRFVRTHYPEREAVIYIQTDGKGHKLHGHVLISNVSLTDHRACEDKQHHLAHVKTWLREIASKIIDLDSGRPAWERRTQTERVKKEKADILCELHRDKSPAELRDILIKEGAYSYKEDLRERIKEAAAASKNEHEFFAQLKESGVIAQKKHSKKHGDYILYDFLGCPVSVRNTQSRSYKLGFGYGPEGLNLMWKKNEADIPQNSDDDISGFVQWLNDIGESYMTFDATGNLIDIDFEKMDRLHAQYEVSLEIKSEQPAEKNEDDTFNAVVTTPKKKGGQNTKKLHEKHRAELKKNLMTNRTNDNSKLAADILKLQNQIAILNQTFDLDDDNTENYEYY